MKRVIWVALLTALLTACGGDNSSTSPTSPSVPSTAQVGGVWNVTATTNSVSSADCLGALLQTFVGGVDRGTMQFTQSGSSLSSTLTITSNGSNYTFSGTAGASSIALNELTCSSCNLTGVTCSNGARRDMRLQTGGINASVSGGTATGSFAETFNVFVSGTSTSVGTLVINANFSATKS